MLSQFTRKDVAVDNESLQQINWNRRSSGMLRGVDRLLPTFRDKLSVPIFKDQAVSFIHTNSCTFSYNYVSVF